MSRLLAMSLAIIAACGLAAQPRACAPRLPILRVVVPHSRGGPCGCKAGKACHAPCDGCCGGHCECQAPPPRTP